MSLRSFFKVRIMDTDEEVRGREIQKAYTATICRRKVGVSGTENVQNWSCGKVWCALFSNIFENNYQNSRGWLSCVENGTVNNGCSESTLLGRKVRLMDLGGYKTSFLST
jgi:hypothetical protein